MLSLYGRFALNPVGEEYKILDNEADFIKSLRNQSYVSHNILRTQSNKEIFIVREKASRDVRFSSKKGNPFLSPRKAKELKIASQISAAIASYVRIKLYDILSDKGLVWCSLL